METVTCKNCNTAFQGTYCNQCGQHAIQRFNFSYLWSLLSQDLFEVDRGLWHTMKDLTVRPGYMIHDFLNGKTRQYFSPLKYLIISIGVFYLMMTIGGAISGESGSIESQWTENVFLREHRLLSVDTMLDFFDVVTALISINMTLYFVLLLPFLAIALKIFFSTYNFVEHLISLGFAWGHLVFSFIPLSLLIFVPMRLLNSPVPYFTFFTGAAIPVLFGYFTWIYKQLTTGSWIRTFLKLMAAVYCGYFFFFGISFLTFLIVKIEFAG